MAKKNKKIYLMSPIATLQYPYIFKADKFKNDEKYKVTFNVPIAEAQEMIKTIDDALARQVNLESLQGNTEWEEEHYVPYEVHEAAGYVQFYSYLNRFGNKGKPDQFEQRPAVFDAQNNPIAKPIQVFNGSRGRVQTEINAWTGDKNCGVTLRLKAVQLIEVVKQAVVSAETYGFQKTEGFSANDPVEGEPAERQEY